MIFTKIGDIRPPLTDRLLSNFECTRQLSGGAEPADSFFRLHSDDSKAYLTDKSSLLNQRTSKLYAMDTLGERIRYARERAGLDQAGLAKLVGVSKSAVNQWELGKTKNLRLDNLFKLERATGFAAMWIGVAEGPMKRGDNTQDRPSRQTDQSAFYLIAPEAFADILDTLEEHQQQSGEALSNERKGEIIAKFCTRLMTTQRQRDRARVASIINQVLHEGAP